MIPETVIEEIRSRVDPVEVIGRRVELRKNGKSFSASCPFHPDRTPSFHVFPDSKRFKCFGCGARGDVFEFLRRFEGKDFRTAVRELASEFGVTTPASGPDPTSQPAGAAGDPGRAVLERACEAAAAHWSERLWSEAGAPARDYLAARGIQEATARQFRLGFAPREWHDLEQALGARGFASDNLLRAGLIRKSEKAHPATHDYFRGRVIFPFVRSDRCVVGFGGRDVPAKGETTIGPKYLNSPETPIFRKGYLLFGLPEAQVAIRSSRRAILVEGYFDAVAVHQAGAREVVACGGTALTDHQVGLLQRAGCDDLVLLFDTDPPGLDAPVSAAPALLRSALTVRVARLPGDGTDPAAFLRAGGSAGLPSVLDAATPLTEWLIERTIAVRTRSAGPRGLSVEQKLLIVRDLRPFVAAARPGLPHALFEQRIARRLELYIVALRAELGRGDARKPQAARGGGAPWHA